MEKNDGYLSIDENGEKGFLRHYGTPRHSGRYPWGSGENPYQRQKDFTSYVKKLQAQGLSQVEIAKGMNMSTTQLRAKLSNAKIEMRAAETAELKRLVDKGWSVNAASKRLGITEATARNRLTEIAQQKADSSQACANMLKEQVNEKKYLDVGKGTEQYLGVSSTKLNNTLALLQEQGYNVHNVQFEQVGTGEKTTMKVLTKGDVPWKEVNEHKFDVLPVADVYLEGDDWHKVEPPRSIDSKTVQVNYTVDGKGGVEKDGLIEIRPGVPELSLGGANYAQVRIAVDGTNYMKGMAVYAYDLPDGINVRYNSNKAPGTPLFDNPDPLGETVFKKMKEDKENPFGATIKEDAELHLVQRHYTDADGNQQLSAINVVNEQGNWEQWSRTLSSQMLSKQSPALAKRQLAEAYKVKEEEFNEIMGLTNPTLKKYLLDKFAGECDSAAVHMKAAAIPGTASHVLIPFPNMKENEIYAPGYPDGSKVVLIRYPHGGTFEIPELTVNNHYPEARKILGNAPDAVGIHPKAAKQLSGADFDGDTALVIPNNDHAIKSRRVEELSPSLASVRDFDPSAAYPGYPGMAVIKPRTKQKEMGVVTNLIADMTIKGATDDEIAKAVRHSMVIIDAEKHKLNYKQSYIDNGIAELKAKYQTQPDGRSGASTIITRAKSPITVDARKEGQWVKDPVTGKSRRLFYDPNTGEKLFEPKTDRHNQWVGKDGKLHTRQEKTTRMAEATDAYTLTSGGSKEHPGTLIEAVYAEHANRLKALANRSRLISMRTADIEYNPSAREAYAPEVASLRAKLNQAEKNAPLERKAQLLANKTIQAKLEANPNMDSDKKKKVRGQALRNARKRVNPNGKNRIEITDREWKAIQSGAVHKGFLREILKNTDLDKIKSKAMPRTTSVMSAARTARAKAMLRNGHTQAAVAEALGVSVSTLMRSVSGED